MKRFLTSIFTGLALFAALTLPAASQQPMSSPQAAVEPLGENEPIPFMHSEQAATTEEPSSAGLLLKTIASMVFIVGLIFVGAWAAKKFGYGNAKSGTAPDGVQLSVLTSVSLGNGRTVSAINFGSRVLLVGSTPQSFTLLAEDERGGEAEIKTPRSVAELLARDNSDFDTELKTAESRLKGFTPGGKIG